MRRFLLLALGALVPATALAAARDELRITSIDVEGGAATLVVTPDGRSLLIDTGWPTGRGVRRPAPGEAPPPPAPTSAERIVAAARAAGLERIDHVLITHYHVDHVGGVFDLVKLMPVGQFIDHGPNREVMPPGLTPEQQASAPATLYPQYEALLAGRKRTILKAGDELRIGRLVVTAITSDGTPITRPVGRGPQPDCSQVTTMAENGGEENPRSLGVMLSWGSTRVLSLADATWEIEARLACPVNLTGQVDLMFADNHGSGISSNPVLLAAANPRLVVVNNGATKGGDGGVLTRLKALPRLQAVWQLHAATRAADANTATGQIVNVDRDANGNLSITADRRGGFTLVNPRTGETARYSRR